MSIKNKIKVTSTKEMTNAAWNVVRKYWSKHDGITFKKTGNYMPPAFSEALEAMIPVIQRQVDDQIEALEKSEETK